MRSNMLGSRPRVHARVPGQVGPDDATYVFRQVRIERPVGRKVQQWESVRQVLQRVLQDDHCGSGKVCSKPDGEESASTSWTTATPHILAGRLRDQHGGPVCKSEKACEGYCVECYSNSHCGVGSFAKLAVAVQE